MMIDTHQEDAMDWKFEQTNGQTLPVMANGLVPLVSRCWIGGISPGEKFGVAPEEASRRIAARHADLAADANEALNVKMGKKEEKPVEPIAVVIRVHDPHDTEPPVSGLVVPAFLPASPSAVARASLNMSPETAGKAVISASALAAMTSVDAPEAPKQAEDLYAEQQRKARKEKTGEKAGHRTARENSTAEQDEAALNKEEAQRETAASGGVTVTIAPEAIVAAQSKAQEKAGVALSAALGSGAHLGALAAGFEGPHGTEGNRGGDEGHPPSAASAKASHPAEGAHTKNSPPGAKK